MAGANALSGQALGDVLPVDPVDVAPVFLIDVQLPAAHLQGGLELQQIGPQGGEVAAAPPLAHELQGIQHEAGLHLVGEAPQVFGDGGGVHPAVPTLRALDGQQAHAGGELAAVHHIDPVQFLRRQPGGVVGGGQLAADGQMHHLAARRAHGPEEFHIVLHAGGAGQGQDALCAVAPVHVLRREVVAVQEGLVPQRDGHGLGADVEAPQQLPGEVAAAVRADEDALVHKVSS